MKYLLALLILATSPALATSAHTKAYLFDELNPLEMESSLAYDIRNDASTAEIRYIIGDTLLTDARAAPVESDVTFNGVRIFFAGLSVQASVNGVCATGLVIDHSFQAIDLKVFQGGTLIGPSSNSPPINDIYPFDGGSVTFNAVTSDDHSVSITGIVLAFDTGERHTWGFASADLACTIPVELQSFTVD